MPIDIDWIRRQVHGFEERRSIYQDFSRILQDILMRAVSAMGIPAIVQVRAKAVPSFAEKCIRKREKYLRPLEQLTDLCGARVIVESRDRIEPVCAYIRDHFEIDAVNSEDVMGRLRSSEFGYLSIHFVFSLRGDVDYGGTNIPAVLLERRDERESRLTGLPPGPKYKAELQVRTLLQHAWASLVHDNLYKADFHAPAHLERDAARIAAKLEDTDDSFARLLDNLRFYRSHYGAYMSPERIREEIEILEAVRSHDPGNVHLAQKIASLAMSVADWDKAIDVLSAFSAGRPAGSASVLRDLGMAYRGRGDGEQACSFLRESIELDPNDTDALCGLGDTLSPPEDAESPSLYERAFRIDPAYPRALRSYLQCMMLRGNPGVVEMVGPYLDAAIRICREWAAVGLHLPRALYDMGFFSLLLGRPLEGLAAYCGAVERSATEAAVDEERVLIGRLHQKSRSRDDLAGYLGWAERLLAAAMVSMAIRAAESSAHEVERRAIAAKRAKTLLDAESSRANVDEADLATARKKALEASSALEKAIRFRDAMEKKVAGAPSAFLDRFSTTPCANASDPFSAKPKGVFDRRKPVVIVAGGCDASVERKMREYGGLVRFAFDGYDGAVVSGGTKAGVAGLVGDLPNPGGRMRKVAFLPETVRSEHLHYGYTIHRTSEKDYSALGPIQTWIDILASGVRPGDVRLLGIGGGDISAFEYRLALAMGARVGVVQGSGGAAAEIADDPDWKSHPGLLLLPRDDETVRLFLQPPARSETLEPADREGLARMAHEEHRKSRSRLLVAPDPAMADWEDLIPSLKASNLAQVDHIEAKLRRVGLGLRKVLGRDIKLHLFRDEAQIKELARLEHARWNMERLADGWTRGERDPIRKRTPFLVPWDDLSEEVQGWDRLSVTELPRRLKDLGYEIFDPASEDETR